MVLVTGAARGLAGVALTFGVRADELLAGTRFTLTDGGCCLFIGTIVGLFTVNCRRNPVGDWRPATPTGLEGENAAPTADLLRSPK
jgi:hypothetical protein